jgi:hypothetical protein
VNSSTQSASATRIVARLRIASVPLSVASRIKRSNHRRTLLVCSETADPARSGTRSFRSPISPGTARSHCGELASRTTSSRTASHGSHSGRARFKVSSAEEEAIIAGSIAAPGERARAMVLRQESGQACARTGSSLHASGHVSLAGCRHQLPHRRRASASSLGCRTPQSQEPRGGARK